MARRRHKYGVSRPEERTVDGIVFDSKKEAKRYSELKLMEKADIISELRLQPKFEWITACEANGNRVERKNYYKADFWYLENGLVVVEDVKGFRTAEYKRKKKIVESLYGCEIHEV